MERLGSLRPMVRAPLAAGVQPSGRLWAFANYSRFVRPGAVRIGAMTSDGGLDLVTFVVTG